jgi:hypothetical protein
MRRADLKWPTVRFESAGLGIVRRTARRLGRLLRFEGRIVQREVA